VTQESIHELIRAWSQHSPDSPALLAPGREPLTYARLEELIRHVGGQLRQLGIGRNDPVAVVLPNGPDLSVTFLAVSSVAACAPLNPDYRASELASHMRELKPTALVVAAATDSPAAEAAGTLDIAVIEITPDPGAPAGVFSLTGPGQGSGSSEPPAQGQDIALLLPTSGTTSRPKLVPLTQANLCASAQNHIAALALTARDRCLNVMPLFHIHALISVLVSSMAAGASVVCTPGFYADRFFAWMEAFRPTWYTASPALHQLVLARAHANSRTIAACPLRFVRSAAAALPPEVMEQLERVFNAPVIESFGMTEAAAQITSNPLPPGRQKPGSAGVAAGPEVAILSDAGERLPAGKVGEIVLRGANVTKGYRNNPAANQDAFVDGWLRSGDQGYLDEEGYLFITGRLKELINKGGEMLSPREVDEVLMDHPDVVQAVTFAIPDSRLGEEVAAAVRLREESLVSQRDIQEFAAGRLADFKVPRKVVFVDEIPKGPTGKIQRIGLAENLGIAAAPEESTGAESAFAGPAGELEIGLTRIWEGLLGVRPISVNDNFFDLGGYSLLAARLFARIEGLYGKRLPALTLLEAPTIRQLAAVLRQEERLSRHTSLVTIQDGGSRTPFFCVPGVGGDAVSLATLARRLGPDQPFYGLRARGQDGCEPPHTSIEEMACEYLREIQRIQTTGSYLLGGRCVGGLVAFEMALQLERQGQKVALLALFDSSQPPPHETATAFVRTLLLRFMRRDRALYCLSRELRVQLTNLRFQFPMSGEERRFKRLWNAHRQARRSYQPGPFSGRVTLFTSEEWAVRWPDQQARWSALSAGVDLHAIPGGHRVMVREPNVRALACELKPCLALSGKSA